MLAAQGRADQFVPSELPALVLDFGLIVPEPENMEEGGCSHIGARDLDENFVDPTTGKTCWYAWRIAKWGTKWGGYEWERDGEKLRFETAWSHPFPVMGALAERFSEDTITVRFADEDFGSNVGRYVVRGEEVLEQNFPGYGEESCEMAAQIIYGLTYAEVKASWGEDD